MAQLSSLTYFIRETNLAIDTGKHSGVTIQEVEEHIEQGDIISYLQTRLDRDADLSLISDEHNPIEATEITHGL